MSKRKKSHRRKLKKYRSQIQPLPQAHSRPYPLMGRLLIALALGTVLAAATVTGIRQVQTETNVKELVELVGILTRACQRYYSDVGAYPMEFSDVGSSQYLARNLTRETGSPSWNGPYITQYLLALDVPLQAAVRVHNYIDSARGFDLDGNGTVDRQGEGNYVDIWFIPEELARLVDRRLDGILLAEHWQERGAVKYAAASGRLSVFLAGGTPQAARPAEAQGE